MIHYNSENLAIIIVIALLIFLIPTIFFLITQQNTLKAIQPQNRMMSPGEVWLQLIPLFNLVWQFIVVSRIANSLQRELSSSNTFSFEQQQNYTNTNTSYGPKPTLDIGIASCVLKCCFFIPLLGSLCSIAGLICWIIYWVKLSEYKNLVQSRRYEMSSSQDNSRY